MLDCTIPKKPRHPTRPLLLSMEIPVSNTASPEWLRIKSTGDHLKVFFI